MILEIEIQNKKVELGDLPQLSTLMILKIEFQNEKKLSWVIFLNQVGPAKCVEQALDRLHAQVKPFLFS